MYWFLYILTVKKKNKPKTKPSVLATWREENQDLSKVIEKRSSTPILRFSVLYFNIVFDTNDLFY